MRTEVGAPYAVYYAAPAFSRIPGTAPWLNKELLNRLLPPIVQFSERNRFSWLYQGYFDYK